MLAENAIATALGLGVIILVLAPISGAHLNPVISLVDSLLVRLLTTKPSTTTEGPRT